MSNRKTFMEINNRDLQVYTTWKAAKELLVTPTTIIKWIREGRMKTIRTVGGHRRIPREEIKKVKDIMWKDMRK